MRWKAAVALSTLCSLAACETVRVAVPLRPDLDNPTRLICEAVPARPAIPAEYVIDWSRVTTVTQARAEHDAYVRSVRSRENIVVAHIVTLEGRLFVCSNNAQWWRDYWSGLPAE
jgi:hypothetical protein